MTRPTAAPTAPPVEVLLELAVRHVNAGQPDRAVLLCEHARATHAPHPGVLQLLALLTLQRGDAAVALRHAQASLVLRPGHASTCEIAADAWFQRALAHQAARDPTAEAEALRAVLRLAPGRAEAAFNLGVVMQESGALDDAMQAFGRAYRLRNDTFGRIAHALAAAPRGRVWLRLDELRAALLAAAQRPQNPAMTPTLSMRAATAADVPFLMTLRRQTMNAHLEAAGADTAEEAHRARLLYRYDAAQILLEAGEPVGLLKVTRDATEWTIVQIQVLPRLQGRGLGAVLLREVIAAAQAAGAALTLGVLQSNPAKGLYERLGFVVVGEAHGEWLMRWRG